MPNYNLNYTELYRIIPNYNELFIILSFIIINLGGRKIRNWKIRNWKIRYKKFPENCNKQMENSTTNENSTSKMIKIDFYKRKNK